MASGVFCRGCDDNGGGLTSLQALRTHGAVKAGDRALDYLHGDFVANRKKYDVVIDIVGNRTAAEAWPAFLGHDTQA